MKCKQTWTSKECIEEIIKSNPGLLTQSPDEYVLYVNKNVSTGEATWFDEDKHMSSFGLQDKVRYHIFRGFSLTLKMKCRTVQQSRYYFVNLFILLRPNFTIRFKLEIQNQQDN